MSLKYLASSTSDIYRMRQCSIVLSRYRGAQQAPHLDGSMVVGKGILHNPLTHNVRIYGKQGVHCTCRCGRVGHPHTSHDPTRETRVDAAARRDLPFCTAVQRSSTLGCHPRGSCATPHSQPQLRRVDPRDAARAGCARRVAARRRCGCGCGWPGRERRARAERPAAERKGLCPPL